MWRAWSAMRGAASVAPSSPPPPGSPGARWAEQWGAGSLCAEAWPEQVCPPCQDRFQDILLSFIILVTSSTCHSALASNPEKGWQVARPLAVNVSHAASASLGDNMFVFGGQRTEACDDIEQV